jgi:ribose 5-phosphate isomerase B
MMRIGTDADHGGFELKAQLTAVLKAVGYEVADFGAHELVTGDDYPDLAVPLAKAVARRMHSLSKEPQRGIPGMGYYDKYR